MACSCCKLSRARQIFEEKHKRERAEAARRVAEAAAQKAAESVVIAAENVVNNAEVNTEVADAQEAPVVKKTRKRKEQAPEA